MRILISNDDGILAPGLAALYGAMADLGEVYVVAPSTPQSAAGHGITLRSALAVQRLTIDGPPRFEGVSVSGSPADCVRLAIRNLLPAQPDLVLSGINAGSNVGINVFYSGTVAAAAEAAMFGIPAVAFSLSLDGEVDFVRAAGHCRRVLDRLLSNGLKAGDLVNVNIPALSPASPCGVVVVKQSTVGIEDIYEPHAHPEGLEAWRLSDKFCFMPEEHRSDVVALADGCITITPLHVDMTNHAKLAELEKDFRLLDY